MHSVHVAAAVPSLVSLERQFRETALYDEIITHRAHHLCDGAIELSDTEGVGMDVDWTHPTLDQKATWNVNL